jgi:hypothetical protein
MRRPICGGIDGVKRTLILSAIVILALAGAGLYLYGGGHTPADQPPLQDLTPANVPVIRNAFNAAKDDTRMLLLLSPT